MIAIDLSKLQELDVGQKPINQTSFARNVEQDNRATMFFIIEEAKETILDFSQRTVKVL